VTPVAGVIPVTETPAGVVGVAVTVLVGVTVAVGVAVEVGVGVAVEVGVGVVAVIVKPSSSATHCPPGFRSQTV